MAYCNNCGRKISDNVKFCAFCDTYDNSKRRVVYEGETHQCPQCGEVLEALVLKCPTCGFEFRDTQSSRAIREFARKLENATSQSQRIAIIKSFGVPNNREDIFEFMNMACANFDAYVYASHIDEEDESDAWLAKIEQCYNKAHIIFRNPHDLQKIDDLYFKNKKECEIITKELQTEKRRNESTHSFKTGNFKYILFVFAIISALMMAIAFNTGKIVSGIVSLFILVLNCIAILMGYNVIKEKVTNIKIAIFILAIMLIVPYFCLYSNDWSFKDLNENYIKIEYSYEQLLSNDYKSVENILKLKGFEKITIQEVDWNDKYEPGQVVEVLIDGKAIFDANARFKKDSLIVISYIGRPKQIEIGFDYKDLIGLSYTDVYTKLRQLGFANIERLEKDWIPSQEPMIVLEVSVDGNNKFVANSIYPQDVKIVLTYYKSPQSIYLTYASDELVGMDYEEVKQIFLDLGFVYIELIPQKLDKLGKGHEVIEVRINGSSKYPKGHRFTADSKIEIYYYKNIWGK